MTFNQGCRGLIPRHIIRSDFGYWAVLAQRPKLEAAAQGTTFVELSTAKLRAERIPIPDLPTQEAIADFLDRETARIGLLIERVGGIASSRMAAQGSFLSLLQEKRSAPITAAVTGQIDVATWGRRGDTDRRLEAIEHDIDHLTQR